MPTTQHKPFQGFAPAAVDYLNTLAANNNKTWFSEHKGEFKELLQFPMQDLAAQVYDAMLCRRPDAQLAVKLSRIYRDQRRYKDGSYCHTRLWFNIFDPAIPDGPYFWFEVGHERWNYGLSLLTVSPATMETFRQKLKSTTFAFTIKNYHDQLCQDTEFHLYAPQDNFQTMVNYVFSKDDWAHIRYHDGRRNVPLTDWAKEQCRKAIYDIGFVHQGPNFRQTNTVAVCEECLAELGKVVAATLAQEREDEDETPISHQ